MNDVSWAHNLLAYHCANWDKRRNRLLPQGIWWYMKVKRLTLLT